MPGADKIIQKILEDAEKKENEIINEADQRANAILEEARKEADEIWQEHIDKAKKAGEEAKRRVLAMGELEARKYQLSVKQSLIDEVFDLTYAKFKEIPNDKYEKWFIDMIVKYAEGNEAYVFIADNDRSRLSSSFIDDINEAMKKTGKNTKVSFSKEERDISRGFVLMFDQVEMNASIHSLIDGEKELLQQEIVKQLFG